MSLSSSKSESKRKLLHDGQQTQFHRTTFKTLQNFDTESLDATDLEMHCCGFSSLGDMSCTVAPDMVMRGYASGNTECLGVHAQSDSGTPYTEFFSQFENGSSLTTTTNITGGSWPEKGIYRNTFNNIVANELHRHHKKAIDSFCQDHHTTVRPMAQTLVGLAEAIDEFLQRYED